MPHDDLGAARRFVREPERSYMYDRTVAERVKDRILAAMGERVRRVILFGSRARGDALPDSDYDVLVVLDKLVPGERHGILVDLYRAVRQRDAVVEPHVMSQERFEETKKVIGGLAYPAWTEGVVLYEHA